jgi:glycosyltransferase involved in cell wall biosynthesis
MTRIPSNPPNVTIVTPVYNEELCLEAYRETLENVLFNRSDVNFDVIFVDDGSTDKSWRIIEKICEQSSRFRALRLSRNFGSHVALSAGLQHAKGDAVATLACDLQDPPQTIIDFIKKWQDGAKIVWGKRHQRADSPLRIWTSNIFSYLLKKFAMPKNSKFSTGSFFLIDRYVVKCFKRFQEHNRITFALVAWTGFDQEVVIYSRHTRFAGKSKWTFSQMLKTLGDAFVAFSNLPARAITSLGVFIWLSSIIFAIYLVIKYLSSNVLPGWTGLMLTISFMFGMVFLILGLAVEYLRRIHIEVTSRPLYFISEKVNFLKKEGTYGLSNKLATYKN